MSTYTQLIYQIVFTPKHKSPILEKSNRPILFKYITGLLKNKKCHLYQINGVEDHIHILTYVLPTISLSNLVMDIKVATSFNSFRVLRETIFLTNSRIVIYNLPALG